MKKGNPLDIVATVAFLTTAWVITAMVARMRKLTEAQLTLRFEERLAERTRIARELHDTLLQSFQGLMLHFQAVNDLLPAGKAKGLSKRLSIGPTEPLSRVVTRFRICAPPPPPRTGYRKR